MLKAQYTSETLFELCTVQISGPWQSLVAQAQAVCQ